MRLPMRLRATTFRSLAALIGGSKLRNKKGFSDASVGEGLTCGALLEIELNIG